MAEAACFPRGSLFLASRLASIVQKFKLRLQEKVQSKKRSPNPFGNTYHRGIRLRALSDLEKCAPPIRLTVTNEPRSAVEHQGHGKWINEVLRDLHKNTTSSTFSLTRVAADDKILLSHAQDSLFETLTQNATLPQIAYLFDSVTFLIGRLEALLLENTREWAEVDADCKRLKEESYIANLLHLLRRLQYVLFQVLVHRSITHLDEFAQHWQTYWQQQKKLGEDWFTEWPSGQRPLSTTWPWNIRPSLVVLWGVCWMFYTPEPNNEDRPPRSPAQQLVEESVNWMPDDSILEVMRQATHTVGLAIDPTNSHTRTASAQASPHSPSPGMITSTSQAATMMAPNLNVASQSLSAGIAPPHTTSTPGSYYPGSPYPTGISHGSPGPQGLLQLSSPFRSNLYPQPVPSTLYTNTSPTQSRDLTAWTTPIGGDRPSPFLSDEQLSLNVLPGYSPTASSIYHQPRTPVLTVEISPEHTQSHGQISGPINTEGLYPPYQQSPCGYSPDMGGPDVYPPSPESVPGRQCSITSPISPVGSANADHITSPSSTGSKGLQTTFKRGDPPRNALKQIHCTHADCATEPPTFRRPSDWNKHMDKHERPYKCYEVGCDKMQGFTYSGGLLRHQREVHKTNRATSKDLFCHYENCNRSVSHPNAQAFTRHENLKEHIRRRHVPDGGMTSPVTLSVMATPVIPPRSPQERSRKRKRTLSTDLDDELQSRADNSDEEVESQPAKRLKRTIAQKDDRIHQLDGRIRQLEAQLAATEEQLATVKKSMLRR